VSRFLQSNQHITTNIKRDQTFLIASTIKIRSLLYGSTCTRGQQRVPFRPQKEGKVAKSPDHLDLQVSLDNDNVHNNTRMVPSVGGKFKQFAFAWQTITSDYFILSAIKGIKIEFANYPNQTVIPCTEYNFNATENC